MTNKKYVNFPAESYVHLNLADENREFLSTQTLQKRAAPHLYFGDFDGEYLPSLNQWKWGEDWKYFDSVDSRYAKQCQVVGAAQDNAPLFLKPGDSQIYAFREETDFEIPLAKSLHSLKVSLTTYAEMIDIAISFSSGIDFLENKVVPLEIWQTCLDKLVIVNSSLSVFWVDELSKWKFS